MSVYAWISSGWHSNGIQMKSLFLFPFSTGAKVNCYACTKLLRKCCPSPPRGATCPYVLTLAELQLDALQVIHTLQTKFTEAIETPLVTEAPVVIEVLL